MHSSRPLACCAKASLWDLCLISHGAETRLSHHRPRAAAKSQRDHRSHRGTGGV